MENKEITIDATGKALGRLASEVSVKLRGKDNPDFVYHQDKGPKVTVENVAKATLSGKKMEQKEYTSYSGYPSGLKKKTARELTPAKRLEKAVYGMLPKNKLRSGMMKRLTIK